MNVSMNKFFVGAAGLSLVANCVAASFECDEAKTRIEKAVCADAELSRLDGLVGRFYLGAKLELAENAVCIEVDQRRWLRGRDACADAACLRTAYLERLAELVPLQRGIDVPADLELPARPALLWSIAPLASAPASSRAAPQPLEVQGRLGYGCPECGYYLRADGGKTYLLVDDLHLGGATAGQLAELRETGRDARLLARGVPRADGRPGFDNRHCVFLYLLP
jgi:hypothetical protein